MECKVLIFKCDYVPVPERQKNIESEVNLWLKKGWTLSNTAADSGLMYVFLTRNA